MKTYTVIDVETTGIDILNDSLIEVAAVKIDQNTRVIGSFESFVSLSSGDSVPKRITELTGITDNDLLGAPNARDVKKMIHDFIKGSTVVAHFAVFDMSFLDLDYAPFICTKSAVQLLDPGKSSSLKKVCERYNIQLSGHHRAINDAKATGQLLSILLDKARNKGVDIQNTLVESDERHLPYYPYHAKIVKL